MPLLRHSNRKLWIQNELGTHLNTREFNITSRNIGYEANLFSEDYGT